MDLQVQRDNDSGEFDVVDNDLDCMQIEIGFKTADSAKLWIHWTFEVDDVLERDFD